WVDGCRFDRDGELAGARIVRLDLGELDDVGGGAEARKLKGVHRDAALSAASRIPFVTAAGREIIERCPALTLVMWAWARFAMNSWIEDGIALSIVPTRSQLGIVFQAGGPDGAVKPLNTAGPWVAWRTAPSFAGRSLANPFRKTLDF